MERATQKKPYDNSDGLLALTQASHVNDEYCWACSVLAIGFQLCFLV